MKRNFEDIIVNLKESIADFGYYVDFNKVYENVDNIKTELCLLNSLVGSKNIEQDFIKLVEKYPECLKVVPILLAIRNEEIFILDDKVEKHFKFYNLNYTIQEYVEFMQKSGLFELISDRIINNLVDYVTGVEVGLDSNGRKNRGGHLMEDLVESYIKKMPNVIYHKEMKKSKIKELYGIDLSSVAKNEKTEKRFDFVVKTEQCLYLIETNFYASGGSKLNETARSYKMLNKEIEQIEGVKFVWITDGKGWISARHNLEETYNEMECFYTIKDLEENLCYNKNIHLRVI